MARRLLVVIAVIAVCAAALLWWRRSDTPSPTTGPATPEPAVAAATAPNAAAREAAAPSVPTAQTPESRARTPAAPVQAPASPPPAPRTDARPTAAALAAMLDAPIDRNHATDLFAEHLAKLDEGGDSLPEKESAQRLQAFAARADGGDASLRIARDLQTHLDEWLSRFPSERANHFALIAVECKVGACQVLLAESSIDPRSEAGRAALDNLTSGLIALMQTPWAQQLGLALLSSDMTATDVDADGMPRYALWTIYLSVASAG